MASIKLDWSGATASTGIKGYEISYKESTDSLWTNFPFITSSSSSGTYTWSGAEYYKDYNFRIRTQDNDDLYSIYKTVNISTAIPGNLPPETVDSYILDYVTSDSIALDFFNASDDFGIKGHEVSYKKSTDSVYTTLPFISSPSFDLTVFITGLDADTLYDIRVRTQDIYDLWSLTYYQIQASTEEVVSTGINRSASNINPSLGFTAEDACSLLTVGSDLLYSTAGVAILNVSNILYTDSGLTTPFNGLDRIWLISDIGGSAGVIVNSSGVIIDIFFC